MVKKEVQGRRRPCVGAFASFARKIAEEPRRRRRREVFFFPQSLIPGPQSLSYVI